METPASQASSSTVRPGSVTTHYAPPDRASADELRDEYAFLGTDPIIAGLMRATKGLIAVLNEHRQVLALNESLLHVLGLGDSANVLGLRLGEVLQCAHAQKPPAGCGTTEFCSTCGAAIAQVASLATDTSVERVCAIDVKEGAAGSDHYYFRVQACPIRCGDRRILLLFLHDISHEQQRVMLDRMFFHDVNNVLFGIMGLSELLADEQQPADPKLARDLVTLSRRLAREIELQRCIVKARLDQFTAMPKPVPVQPLLDEAARMCGYHPAGEGRRFEVLPVPEQVATVTTDVTLLGRILQNMAVNALEATAPGGVVRLWVEAPPGAAEFCVWNDAVIPSDVARRVFQRNFSTKGGLGRGYGTYSMKLLGERTLTGRVSFTSEPGKGTCFRFHLPQPDSGS